MRWKRIPELVDEAGPVGQVEEGDEEVTALIDLAAGHLVDQAKVPKGLRDRELLVERQLL